VILDQEGTKLLFTRKVHLYPGRIPFRTYIVLSIRVINFFKKRFQDILCNPYVKSLIFAKASFPIIKGQTWLLRLSHLQPKTRLRTQPIKASVTKLSRKDDASVIGWTMSAPGTIDKGRGLFTKITTSVSFCIDIPISWTANVKRDRMNNIDLEVTRGQRYQKTSLSLWRLSPRSYEVYSCRCQKCTNNRVTCSL
jgi:hypothetical protein